MVDRLRRLLRDLGRRVDGYVRFMLRWANVRVGRPDLHDQRAVAREVRGDRAPHTDDQRVD